MSLGGRSGSSGQGASLSASQDLVLRFQISTRLQQHLGCVNTVNFNSDGDILLSGSDDRHATLWDWQAGKVNFSFHTGHLNNVFQAKFMPYTNDRTIVTSAADGQVRHALITEGGAVQTTLLARHCGRVHKLAIEPGSPHIFYTCGEDGLVQHLDLRIKGARGLFTCRRGGGTREGLIIHLNAVAIDPRNPNLFAVAGSDEYARLYDVRKYKWDGSSDLSQPIDHFCPPHLINSAQIGITGLAFSNRSELLVSYYNECIYLFDRNMGLGSDLLSDNSKSDASEKSKSPGAMDSDGTDDIPQVYMGHSNYETVKGVGFFGPKCEYVVSGSDCGRAFIWNRGGKLVRVMEADMHVVNCIEPHPHTAVLASSGIEHDIKVWTPDASERASLPPDITEIQPVDMWFGLSYEDDEEEDYSGEESIGDDDDEEEEDNDDDDDSGTDFSLDDGDDDDDANGDDDLNLDEFD
ncbi:DDB1- and CUL4-associated factor 8-like isoform X2 [Punica granatum]|uniref:DDB1- and CUL4-associated factor 8-like isoform X2 n=1 Tax=Punica granatum TaxID=22663 RepID=A0A6P8CLK0_PUNGR|nr:DDB1- and CUL4-associated factor 8-like isoform X2 [Punica granatum]